MITDSKSLIGKKFGKWTVIQKATRPNNKNSYFLCLCDCGRKKEVSRNSLVRKMSTSCGCSTKAYFLLKKPHWDQVRSHRHSMLNRVRDKKAWPTYAAKNITICDEWVHSSKAFYDWAIQNGFQLGLQLDRIDNQKGYYPENCRWVTPKENMRNSSIPKWQTVNGKQYMMIELPRILGISETTIRYHMKKHRKTAQEIYDERNKTK